MSFGKLIQSNSVRGSRSSSGLIVTTKAVLGIVVVVALLATASLIALSPSIGGGADPTATTTITQTQVLTSVVNLGNVSTQGLNPEANLRLRKRKHCNFAGSPDDNGKYDIRPTDF